METTYVMVVVGAEGMYTYGDHAATPALARVAVGNLIRRTNGRVRLLGIKRCDWTQTDDGPRVARSVLVETEERPGQWDIGSPGTRTHSPATAAE